MSWYTFDVETKTIANGILTIQYGQRYLHNGEGAAITRFEDARTGVNYSLGFDAQYRGQAWDAQPVTLGVPEVNERFADMLVRTGQTDKIDRLYRDVPILEITYSRNLADWTQDFIHTPGAEADIAFVMDGMADVVSLGQGRALWQAAEAQFGHNFGDHFITVNGSTVERCMVDGHFIYGFVNRVTGHGLGIVYPAWITTHEWKVWWTEANRIEIEYAPHGNLGRRWIFAVTQGKDEVLEIGRRLAKDQTWKAQ